MMPTLTEEQIQSLLTPTQQEALQGPARSRPRVALIGAYNAGKTSLVRRLLADAGRAVPPSAEVRSDPTTSTVTSYDIGVAEIIDTPGSEARDDGDERLPALLDAAAEADHILFVILPALWSDKDLLHTLLTRPEITRSAVFTLSQADELGSDPLLDPDGFARRCAEKRAELAQHLSDHGLPSDILVFPIAADPGGLCATTDPLTSDDFADSRDWDGCDALMAWLRDQQPRPQEQRCRLLIRMLEQNLGALPAPSPRRLEHLDAVMAKLAALQERLQDEQESLTTRLSARARAQVAAGKVAEEVWHAVLEKGATTMQGFLKRWLVQVSQLVERPLQQVSEAPGQPAWSGQLSAPSEPKYLGAAGKRLGEGLGGIAKMKHAEAKSRQQEANRLRQQAQKYAIEAAKKEDTGIAGVARKTSRQGDELAREADRYKRSAAYLMLGQVVLSVGLEAAQHAIAARRARDYARSLDGFQDALADALRDIFHLMSQGNDSLIGPAKAAADISEELQQESTRLRTLPQRRETLERAIAQLRHRA